MTVLAIGRSLTTGAEYPVVWTVQHPSGRIAVVTLGHDEAAHTAPAYKTLLANAVRWLAKR
jgi:type 1 glutamine amidotransferase